MSEGVASGGEITWPSDMPGTWQGCPRRPLLEILHAAFERDPGHVPLVFDDGFEVTAGEIRTEVELFAGFLRGRIAPQERVLLAVGNRTEFVAAYLAVVANRGVVVAVSPEIGPQDARYIVDDAGCRLALTDASSRARFVELAADDSRLDEVLTIDGEEPRGWRHLCEESTPLSLAEVACEIDDLTGIGYTSGTTGMPKALGMSHVEPIRYIDVYSRERTTQPEAEHRLLMPLQFHYGDPLTALYTALHLGSTLILMRRFSASRFWDVARGCGATEIMTIGAIPDMLLSRPEGPADRDHRVRSAVALAIPIVRHAELERRFGFPWRETYGSSESGPAISMPHAAGGRFVGTGALGIPWPDIEARLVDESGDVVEGVGAGELELRGEVVFEGYVNNPDATAEVMHDGWLRSGDVMRRDQYGVYYFQGRRKELIRRSGVNVAPAEVEATLRLHEAVVDAAVVPVADEMMGEEIKAYVELVPGVAFDPEDLWEFCSARLSKTKVPRYLEHRVEPFPRTPTQRIPKNELKVDGVHRADTAWDRLAAEGRDQSRRETAPS